MLMKPVAETLANVDMLNDVEVEDAVVGSVGQICWLCCRR